MKKRLLISIALLLLMSMLGGTLASCKDPDIESNTAEDTEAVESESKPSESVSDGEESINSSETKENNSEKSEEESKTETETEKVSLIDGPYADLIENANGMKNTVQAYFEDSSRDLFSLENTEMKFSYALRNTSNQRVSSLTNKNGHAYITDTMDVFVRLKDGNVYYASGSTKNTTANLYRIGMYYYEARFEEQDFFNNPQFIEGTTVTDVKFNTERTQGLAINSDGTLTITNSRDPYAVLDGINYATSECNMMRVKIRAVKGTNSKATLYIMAGGAGNFTSEQAIAFNLNNDGEYHEILFPLYEISGYTGRLTGIRFDIDGNVGDTYEIAEITPCKLDYNKKGPVNLRLCRSFYVYSDKMHHDVQISAIETTRNVAEVGMSTVIDADTVAKLLIKDANGQHSTLDGVNWATVEYVGFDIKEAGIFGYILPDHKNAGKISVTLEDGNYVILQTRIPEKETISPSKAGTENANDFHLSQRIYTDSRHNFSEFIREAEIERNPIVKHITVKSTEFTNSSLIGYDPIRGIYIIDIDGPGTFGGPYYLYQNRYYTADITLTSPDDRNIYIMTTYDKGSLECSVLLDKNNILLPIPVSVCKNFSEAAGERNLYNLDDPDYSESFFPAVLKSGDNYELTVVNIYQNWGKYPLKQISSIQFRSPYYHLSTGVTESNCILPWYESKQTGPIGTLPDFRAMSAPLWESQPQRNSGGSHTFMEYTDTDGNYVAAESFGNYIDSYGPTYADVTMDYYSYDGKIKLTYTHMEMPQTDENRTYYEIRYDVLEDIHIADFKKDFTIYAVTDNEPAATADYRKIGYLNEKNECVVVESNLKHEAEQVRSYVLGDACPYFSMFDMPADASPDGYTNVACLIYNSDIVIGGKKCDADFIITNSYNKVDLSLNLDEVTLKKGDSFVINMILLPWGSHESDYTYEDINVRKVRENTLLNPLTVTSSTDTVIESVFVPKIISKDGMTATFTLKNGYNNVAVRAYGFKKLTVPTLYELIDGEWEKVELSSCDTPDKSGYYNYFDGYMVHYDGDGTYSYSFVTDMDTGRERTFKLDLSQDVTSLPDSGLLETPDPLDIYYDANEIDNLIASSGNYSPKFSNTVVADDKSYVSLYANNVPESFFMVKPDMGTVTGQYIVVKYRIPTTNPTKFNNFEFYLSTSTEQPAAGENIRYNNLKQDGEWHVVVMDAASFSNLPTFKSNENGEYLLRYVRFDMLNTPNLSTDNYIDIGYFGICDTVDEICDLTKDEFEKIDMATGTGEFEIITATGKSNIKEYIAPESGYTKSTLAYYSVIDTLGTEKLNTNGNSVEGIIVKTDYTATVPTKVSMAGWAVIEGGISHFVWSADGGKTWSRIEASLANVSDTYLNHAQTKMSTASGTAFTFADKEATKTNGGFQAPKMTLDLSPCAGQTVDLIIAAVPESAPNTLCLLTCIENLKISAE